MAWGTAEGGGQESNLKGRKGGEHDPVKRFKNISSPALLRARQGLNHLFNLVFDKHF